MPNRAALLQQKHLNRGNDRAYFDSADWAGNLSHGNDSKGVPGVPKRGNNQMKNFRQVPQHHPKPDSETHEQIEHNPTSALGASAVEAESESTDSSTNSKSETSTTTDEASTDSKTDTTQPDNSTTSKT